MVYGAQLTRGFVDDRRGEERQVPARMNQTDDKLYQSTPDAGVDFKEFTGCSHTLIMEPGWEEVANYIADWLG